MPALGPLAEAIREVGQGFVDLQAARSQANRDELNLRLLEGKQRREMALDALTHEKDMGELGLKTDQARWEVGQSKQKMALDERRVADAERSTENTRVLGEHRITHDLADLQLRRDIEANQQSLRRAQAKSHEASAVASLANAAESRAKTGALRAETETQRGLQRSLAAIDAGQGGPAPAPPGAQPAPQSTAQAAPRPRVMLAGALGQVNDPDARSFLGGALSHLEQQGFVGETGDIPLGAGTPLVTALAEVHDARLAGKPALAQQAAAKLRTAVTQAELPQGSAEALERYAVGFATDREGTLNGLGQFDNRVELKRKQFYERSGIDSNAISLDEKTEIDKQLHKLVRGDIAKGTPSPATPPPGARPQPPPGAPVSAVPGATRPQQPTPQESPGATPASLVGKYREYARAYGLAGRAEDAKRYEDMALNLEKQVEPKYTLHVEEGEPGEDQRTYMIEQVPGQAPTAQRIRVADTAEQTAQAPAPGQPASPAGSAPPPSHPQAEYLRGKDRRPSEKQEHLRVHVPTARYAGAVLDKLETEFNVTGRQWDADALEGAANAGSATLGAIGAVAGALKGGFGGAAAGAGGGAAAGQAAGGPVRTLAQWVKEDGVQLYQAAQLQWATAVTFAQSGSQSPPPELARMIEMYFPKPGETSRKTIANKRAMRHALEKSLEASAKMKFDKPDISEIQFPRPPRPTAVPGGRLPGLRLADPTR